MISKNDWPSPFLTFWIVISALSSMFVFFVENKHQSLGFYLTTLGFFVGESLLCALLVWKIKSSTAGIIFISDDEMFKKGMKERQIEMRKKLVGVTIICIFTICFLLLGIFTLKEMYTSS